GTLDQALSGVFNIGVTRESTILELAEALLRVMPEAGSKIKLVPQQNIYGELYEDIPRRVPDNTRMRPILGVDPTTTVEEGLKKTVDYFVAEQHNKEIWGVR